MFSNQGLVGLTYDFFTKLKIFQKKMMKIKVSLFMRAIILFLKILKFDLNKFIFRKKSLTKFVSRTDLKLHNRYCHSAHSIFPASTFRQVQFLFSEAKVSVRPSLFVYSSYFCTTILTRRGVGTQGATPARFHSISGLKSGVLKLTLLT